MLRFILLAHIVAKRTIAGGELYGKGRQITLFTQHVVIFHISCLLATFLNTSATSLSILYFS